MTEYIVHVQVPRHVSEIVVGVGYLEKQRGWKGDERVPLVVRVTPRQAVDRLISGARRESNQIDLAEKRARLKALK